MSEAHPSRTRSSTHRSTAPSRRSLPLTPAHSHHTPGATSNHLQPSQIVVGTPGKVWTLINMRVLDTSKIKVFVLDEVHCNTRPIVTVY